MPTKYYIVRIKHRESDYIKDKEGKILEFDTEKEVRAELREQKKLHQKWFMGWRREEIDVE